jgi:multiple sugar transport system substrate-binding protein
MQDFVKPFNDSSSSYQVVVRELPPPSQSTEVHQQLVQQLGAASGDIDVFTQDVIWPAEFASAGWAMDLSSEFPQAERDKFFPGLVQSVTWQDKLVGLPFYLDAGQLYYRKDVLKDKGMKVPTTWQELATSAKALQGSGDIKNGFLWQGKQAEVLVCNVVSFVGGAGGAILGPDGKTVMIADQPAQTAIQFMYDTMNSLNITPKDVLSWDEEPSRKPFTAGNAAFLRQWSYVWKVSQDASQSQVVGKVGVAPSPLPRRKERGMSGWLPARRLRVLEEQGRGRGVPAVDDITRHPDPIRRAVRLQPGPALRVRRSATGEGLTRHGAAERCVRGWDASSNYPEVPAG